MEHPHARQVEHVVGTHPVLVVRQALDSVLDLQVVDVQHLGEPPIAVAGRKAHRVNPGQLSAKERDVVFVAVDKVALELHQALDQLLVDDEVGCCVLEH